MTPKNDSQSDTQKAKDDSKNGEYDTKNGEYDTKNDTKNWWMKLSVIEANFWNDSMEFINDCFGKEK